MSENAFSPGVESAGDTGAAGRREEIIAAYRFLVEARSSKLAGIIGAFLRSHPATGRRPPGEQGADGP